MTSPPPAISKTLALTGFLASLALVANPVQATTLTIGSYSGGYYAGYNCYPFNCFASQGGTTYQQIYAASQFSSAINISSVSFFPHGGGLMNSADYEISFSTTSAAVSGLSSSWASNIGGDSALFGNYSLSGTMPSVLTFVGNSFSYDPTAGNLLMTVQVSNLSSSSTGSSLQADNTGSVTRNLFAFNGSSTGIVRTSGLVTQFETTSAVPEPLTILGAMTAAGFGAGFKRKLAKTQKDKKDA